MKIAANKISLMPPKIGEGLCVYGDPSEEVVQWCDENGVVQKKSGAFTNFELPNDSSVEDLFIKPDAYRYLDGFSPNLNKHLHLGHLSNLVLAKAFQAIGSANETIAILGDTLDGKVRKEDALSSFRSYCQRFHYPVHHMFFASEMKYDGTMENGAIGTVDHNGIQRDYTGTKVFDVDGEKIVGLKADGSTTYFYQDVALATHLNAPTLYLTGSEQNQHFALLKKMFPHVDHIGLGLVLLNGVKMSSRNEDGSEKTEEEKKAIYAKEVLDMLNGMFDDDFLSYNVLAGQILGIEPRSTKNIDGNKLGELNNSSGLYVSYTTARMKSAGVFGVPSDVFSSLSLGYAYVKSLHNKTPHTLFKAVYEHCMKMNSLYKTHRISDNDANKEMFSGMMTDLELGLKKLGMFSVDKVINKSE